METSSIRIDLPVLAFQVMNTFFCVFPNIVSFFKIIVNLYVVKIIHGRISMGVPLGTNSQISSISSLVTAMQPSVQSSIM